MYSRAISELMGDGDRIKYCWIMLRPTPPPPTEGKNKMGRKSVAKVVFFREMNWCNFLHQFISIRIRIFVGEMEGDTQKPTNILYKNEQKYFTKTNKKPFLFNKYWQILFKYFF